MYPLINKSFGNHIPSETVLEASASIIMSCEILNWFLTSLFIFDKLARLTTKRSTKGKVFQYRKGQHRRWLFSIFIFKFNLEIILKTIN